MVTHVPHPVRLYHYRYVQVPTEQVCADPHLLGFGESIDLGDTDLAEHLLSATTGAYQIAIDRPELSGATPVRAIIQTVARGRYVGQLEVRVDLLASSGVRLDDPRHSLAYVTVGPTGRTELTCERVEAAVVTHINLEPSFTNDPGEPTPTGDTALIATVEFDGRTSKWVVEEGVYRPGDLVRVRIVGDQLFAVT